MGAKLRAQLEAAVKRAVDRACGSPMQWGVDDCGLWVAEPLRETLGYDPAASLRGKYHDRASALAVMGKAGLIGVFRRAAKRHGWKRIDPAKAQVGDVGLTQTIFNGERTLASVICRETGWFVGRSELGVTVVRTRHILACWKVAPHRKLSRPSHFSYTPIIDARSPDWDGLARKIAAPGRALYRPYESGGYRVGGRDLSLLPNSPGQPPQVNHEPISLAIGLTALLEATALFPVLGVTAAQFGGTLVAVGLSIGLSYAASALTQRGSSPISAFPSGAPNDPSIRYNTRQPIPPKRIIYGTAQVGGALFFERTLNPFLYQGLMLCDKPIHAIKKVWIGSNELSFTSLTPDAILAPLAVEGQPAYATHLELSLRLGATDQSIDPIIERDFGGLAGTPVSGATGTNIGTFTLNGGLAAAFDGNRVQVQTACARDGIGSGDSGYIGKDYGAGTEKVIVRCRVTSSSDRQFTDDNHPITVEIQASNNNFVDTVILASATIEETASTFDRGFDNTTAYRYYRARLATTSGAANFYVAEVEFYELGTGAQFRQRGIAATVLKYSFGADQTEYTDLWGQTQRPNPLFLVEGISVPDPRKSGHILEYDPNDPDAVAEAEATWSFSNNASLCQVHYLTQRFGGKIDPRRIDWDKVARAADWDDGLIGTANGQLIRRGTIDGLVTLNQSAAEVVPPMLSANRGFVLESAGRVWVSSSEPRTPVFTVYDQLISGTIEYRAAKPKRDLINKLKVRFVAEDREYQTADGPVLSRADLQESDQEVLESVLDLPFTLDHRRAQQKQKAFLDTARLGRRLTLTCDVELLANATDDLIGNVGNVSSELFPKFDGTYLVESWGFTDNFGSIQLELTEYDSSIETDWDPATDEQAFELTPTD